MKVFIITLLLITPCFSMGKKTVTCHLDKDKSHSKYTYHKEGFEGIKCWIKKDKEEDLLKDFKSWYEEQRFRCLTEEKNCLLKSQ